MSEKYERTVCTLFSEYLPSVPVWVYGSRINGKARRNSDLDTVAFAKPQQTGNINDLREAFDESSLPFRVDLHIWNDLPESFRRNIQENYQVLQ